MPKHSAPLLFRLAALAAGVLVLALLSWAGRWALAQDESPRVGRTLPRFEGTLLHGGRAGTELLQSKRGVIFVFATTDRQVERQAAIMASLIPEANAANVQLLGISRDRQLASALRFASTHGLDFPILIDADGGISRKLKLAPGDAGVLVVDAEGFLIYGWGGVEGDADRMAEYRESELRRILHFEQAADAVLPELGIAPAAPPFTVRSLGGDSLTLEELGGKVVVLVFFLPSCPHCHDALAYLDRLVRELEHPDLRIVAVSRSNRRYVIEEMAETLDLKLALYTDPGGTAARDYAHRLSVPDTLVIDREGRVVMRQRGSGGRIYALLGMQVRQALGVPNPIVLDKNGYSGGEFCAVCHAGERTTWQLTNHAHAFETLIEHGEERNAECLPCHTVGWGEPGGFGAASRYAHLEGVQCENCHGRGGPHQSPQFAEVSLEKTCAGCHTPEHSLRFNFAERLPLISHSANVRFAALSLEERKKLLKEKDLRERSLFETADYVGSETCQTCHAKEHALWSESAHATALQTLESSKEAENSECQSCHTTGFGEPSGWPASSALEGVGCESCHGPGGRHAEDGARDGILRLTEKCETCVLLQICGSCHDEANDPGFEFELMDKLELIRHGFREPRLTVGHGPRAAADHPPSLAFGSLRAVASGDGLRAAPRHTSSRSVAPGDGLRDAPRYPHSRAFAHGDGLGVGAR